MAVCREETLVFLVTMLLSSALGAPTLAVDATPSNYGSAETLKCTDATYSSGDSYVWQKDGVTVFTEAGEISQTGKYSEIIDGTTFKLVINNVVVNDEGAYTCNHAFLDSNTLNLQVESQGTATAKLSSSNLVEVTFNQIYPDTISAVITCDSNTVAGSFVSSVADGDRFKSTWQSTNTLSTKPTSCSASVTLRTTFSAGITFTTAPTEEVYVCFWRESLDSCLECWIYFFLLNVPLLVVAAVLIGIFVEACFEIWESMSWEWRFVSFCVFLFGLGLYLCDYFKKWWEGKPAPPVITSQSNSPNPTSILVEWEKPSDRGYAILFYKITCQKVGFCCICCRNKIDVMVEKKYTKVMSLLKDFLTQSDKPNQTNGHGGNDIEMGHVNPRAQDSGRTLTPLQDGHKKHNLLKKEPLADIQPNKTT